MAAENCYVVNQWTYRERLQALSDDEALNEVCEDVRSNDGLWGLTFRVPWKAGWGKPAGASYRRGEEGRGGTVGICGVLRWPDHRSAWWNARLVRIGYGQSRGQVRDLLKGGRTTLPIFDVGSKYLYSFLVEPLHHQSFSVTRLAGTVVAGWTLWYTEDTRVLHPSINSCFHSPSTMALPAKFQNKHKVSILFIYIYIYVRVKCTKINENDMTKYWLNS